LGKRGVGKLVRDLEREKRVLRKGGIQWEKKKKAWGKNGKGGKTWLTDGENVQRFGGEGVVIRMISKQGQKEKSCREKKGGGGKPGWARRSANAAGEDIDRGIYRTNKKGKQKAGRKTKKVQRFWGEHAP